MLDSFASYMVLYVKIFRYCLQLHPARLYSPANRHGNAGGGNFNTEREREKNMNTEITKDIAMKLNDPEWMLEHITIALQRSSDEELVKRPCDLDGIEQYLMLQGEAEGCHYSIKLTPELLSKAGIDENDAWSRAHENLSSDTQILSLADTVESMLGAEAVSPNDTKMPFHIVTNSGKYKGAACIMNRAALKDFAQKYDANMLFVLPSSIHEMLVAPYSSRFELGELSEMVREVNEMQVHPNERLADRAYVLSL